MIAGDGGGDDDMTTYRIGRGRTMPPQSYRRRMKGESVGAAAARIAVAASVFCWRGRRHAETEKCSVFMCVSVHSSSRKDQTEEFKRNNRVFVV